MSHPAPDWTLAEAKDWLRERVDHGAHCPCCTQHAKIYRRKLNSRMAWGLIRLYRATDGTEWGHLPTIAGDGCEVGKLRYWGLVIEEAEARPDGGRSGWWQLTGNGRAFVKGRLAVPKYARIYDGRCLGLRGEPVTIRDCLGERFNYDELMNGI